MCYCVSAWPYNVFDSANPFRMENDVINPYRKLRGAPGLAGDSDMKRRSSLAADDVASSSDILITETETKTRMIDFSFTETKTNTEKILKTETI